MTFSDRSSRSGDGLDRFFSQGLTDAGRLFPPLAAPTPGDEQAVIVVLESSAIVRLVDRAIGAMARAIETSAALGVVQRIWSVAPTDRRLVSGIALSVAAFVHVGLVAWHERPAGWLWLMLPSLALGVGIVTTFFAGATRKKAG